MKKQSIIHSRIDKNSNHFRRLGLRRGECRIEIIRDAAKTRARELSVKSHPATVDLHRAEIAVSAYRLLDPRGRNDIYERVQLSYPIDLEDNSPPPQPPVSSINRKIDSESQRDGSESEGKSGIGFMAREVIDKAIDLTSEDGEDDASGGDNTDPTIAERRNIVRLLRESEESTLRGLSPLGWLRARLGI